MQVIEHDSGFMIIANYEDEFALWPADRKVPTGWRVIAYEKSGGEARALLDKLKAERRPALLRRLLENGRMRP